MTSATTTTERPSVAARRAGYVIAVLINAAMLFGINIWPGWDVLPFLTDDFTQVLAWVNASIVVSLALNVLYLFKDTKRSKALGDTVSLAVALAVSVLMWRVFPFDFGDSTFDWALVLRIVLGVAIVGTAIAIIVNLVSLVTDTHSRS
ncbi:MAG TPA: hypothetical protein VK204_09615 [Nocardioidaceae bacterium]|jgi:hypothetical protein|nr:hypothetical protein [Nocardioidaceae bacterium]